MTITAKQIRDRVVHSLSPQTAAAAGIRLDELQQVVSGTYSLSQEQIDALARYFNMRSSS
jgi:hypothetical protein